MLKFTLVFLLLTPAAANPQFAVTQAPSKPAAPASPLCSPCIQLSGQGLNILINAILNAGVIGGCSKLCSHLKTPAEQRVCDLVCGAVGIKEFIKALNNTDLDPIYFCELLHACPAGPDDAHVDLLSVKVSPTSIEEKDVLPTEPGVVVEGVLTVNVTKGSGVGEWGVSLRGPYSAENEIANSFMLADGLKEGTQTLGIKIKIADQLPDPTQQPPSFGVQFLPGSYEVRFHLCQGECGSKHPHSIDFGRKAGNFTITNSSGSIVV